MGNVPVPATERESSMRRWLCDPMVQCLVSAGLFYLCFFPVNWGWLGWVAAVPLLHVIATAPPARAYWSAWLGGMAFGLAAVQWIRLASDPMYVFWVLLALLLSLHFLVFAWLTRWISIFGRVPLLLAAPSIWTALEYGRAHIGIGFPWYYLGHTQHDALAVVQIADLFGGYGVSFLVMTVSVVVWQLATGNRRQATGRNLLPVACCLLPVAFSLTYSCWRLGQSDFAPGPRVALLQGNMPQYIRNDDTEWQRMKGHFGELAEQAALLRPDLIVWSETSCYFDWRRIDPACPPEAITPDWRLQNDLSLSVLYEVIQGQVPALLGLNSVLLGADGKKHSYCSALLVDGDAVPRGRYDKIYRIPFGEYIPWSDVFPFLKKLSPYGNGSEYGIVAGKDYTIFTIPGTDFKFGVLICYEDSVPHLLAEYLRGPQLPDFFLNISNDGWFRGSSEHEQHLVAARFRAIECRRPMARSVNMGISSVIDGNGRIVALPGHSWAESKCVPAVLTASIPLDKRGSLYVLVGDLLPWSCSILCLIGLIIARKWPKTA